MVMEEKLVNTIKQLRLENKKLVDALSARNTNSMTKEEASKLNDKFGYFEFGDAQGVKTQDFIKSIEEFHGIYSIEF